MVDFSHKNNQPRSYEVSYDYCRMFKLGQSGNCYGYSLETHEKHKKTISKNVHR